MSRQYESKHIHLMYADTYVYIYIFFCMHSLLLPYTHASRLRNVMKKYIEKRN